MLIGEAGERPVGLAVVGLGWAGQAMAAAAARSAAVRLIAVADADPVRLSAAPPGVFTASELDELLGLGDVELVYVATPTPLHHRQGMAALRAGRHVILEKPMATSLREADELVRLAADAERLLVVGVSHSFDEPARALAELAESGEFGALRMLHNLCYTDWLRRPRKAEDLDSSLGGGVVLRQGAHQFDILRLAAGGLCRRVSAGAAVVDSTAGGEGSYAALLFFENDVVASAVYSGFGHFDSRLLSFGVGEAAEQLAPRPGGAGWWRLSPAWPAAAPSRSPLFGLTIASFEGAEILLGPDALVIHHDEDAEERPYSAPSSGWDALLVEVCSALRRGVPPVHDGPWGRATLEVCLAVVEAARTARDVVLHQQVRSRRLTGPVIDGAR